MTNKTGTEATDGQSEIEVMADGASGPFATWLDLRGEEDTSTCLTDVRVTESIQR